MGIRECLAYVGASVLVATGGAALGQLEVAYTDSSWRDFGSATVPNLLGNFLPGWRTGTWTPDQGQNLFGVPNQTLSGVDGDAAIWLNHFDPSSSSGSFNETVRLALNGFTVGHQYILTFSATILLHSDGGWTGNHDALDVAVTGATMSDFDTTVLGDSGDNDGLNIWVPQSLVFTAASDTVRFEFGGNPEAPVNGDFATRIGIDGFGIVPAPSAALVLGFGGVLSARRRR